MPRDADPWLTEREAAQELRVSVTTVRAERVRIGYIKLRKRIFYPLSQIEAYKASLLCPGSVSGSTPPADDGTSHGPSRTADRSVSRQARRIEALLSNGGHD
jgi:hypothetical protein